MCASVEAGDRAANEAPLTALEFYSGLGGLHYAALLALPPGSKVLDAFDINVTANDVYEHNFGRRPRQCNIVGLSSETLDRYRADIWLLSPPCQPYTRQGHQKQSSDDRAESFACLLSRLPRLRHPPRYILLENVVGFEQSDTHEDMLSTLHGAGYDTQGFVLSPVQYGLPYSRPRYFFLAKKGTFALGLVGSTAQVLSQSQSQSQSQSEQLSTQLRTAGTNGCGHTDHASEPGHTNNTTSQPSHTIFTEPPYVMLARQQGERQDGLMDVPPLGHFLLSQPCATADIPLGGPSHTPLTPTTPNTHTTAPHNTDTTADIANPSPDIASTQNTHTRTNTSDACTQPTSQGDTQQGGIQDTTVVSWEAFLVPDKSLQQSGDVLDVVTGLSTRCKTFTKNYRQFMKGTGSLVCMAPEYQNPCLCTREAVYQRAVARTYPAPDRTQSTAQPLTQPGGPTRLPAECASDIQAQGLGSGPGDGADGEEGRSLHPLAPRLDKQLMASEWRRMQLRYFTPREIATLHGLPTNFSFPSHVSLKARYQLLGNSLCVTLVADLVKYLVTEEPTQAAT